MVTQKPIHASKKDLAKVAQERVRLSSRLDDSEIPEIDILSLAEYGKLNEAYLYFVRNYSKDHFAIIAKKRIIPTKRYGIREEQIAYDERNRRKKTHSHDDRNGAGRATDIRNSEHSGNRSKLRENDPGTEENEDSFQNRIAWESPTDSGTELKFSDWDNESVSSRSLLVNALESVAMNDKEQEKVGLHIRGNVIDSFAVNIAMNHLYQQIDTVSRHKAHGVQDQIIRIGKPYMEGKLKELDHKRAGNTGGDYLPEGIQFPKHTGPDNTKRNKHGGIANEIDDGLPPVRVIHQIYKGDVIDPEEVNFICFQKQRLHNTIHPGEREEGKPGNHNNANIYQQQLQLTAQNDPFLPDPENYTNQNPQAGNCEHGM